MTKAGKKRPVTWDKDRIRTLRYHLNMTQEEMSKEIGTRQQTISEWETGIYRPRGTSVKVLNMVAERSKFRYEVVRRRKGIAKRKAD